MGMTFSAVDTDNTAKWNDIFKGGGPRNFYPHSYVVSWYFKYAKPFIDFSGINKVLDIGCGTAPDLPLFTTQGFHYHGIDVTEYCFPEINNAVISLRLNANLVWLQLFTPPKLPFDNQLFDIVIGLESIHFNIIHNSIQKIVDEIYRVLSPQGHFFFTTIDRDHYFVKSPHSRFVSENCLEITSGFPEKSRVGLRYYVFSDANEIKDWFQKFSEVKVGKYFLDTDDGQPDSYYLIFGMK